VKKLSLHTIPLWSGRKSSNTGKNMPLYLVRHARCIEYSLTVEAPSADEAEVAADAHEGEWHSEPAYWQDLETHELDAEDGENPDIRVPKPEEAK